MCAKADAQARNFAPKNVVLPCLLAAYNKACLAAESILASSSELSGVGGSWPKTMVPFRCSLSLFICKNIALQPSVWTKLYMASILNKEGIADESTSAQWMALWSFPELAAAPVFKIFCSENAWWCKPALETGLLAGLARSRQFPFSPTAPVFWALSWAVKTSILDQSGGESRRGLEERIKKVGWWASHFL